jgi:hypothetical protein
MGLCVASAEQVTSTEQMTSVDQTPITTNSKPIYTASTTTDSDDSLEYRKVVLNGEGINMRLVIQREICYTPTFTSEYLYIKFNVYYQRKGGYSICLNLSK